MQMVVTTGSESEGLLIRDLSTVNCFGKLNAKLYLVRHIHVGDSLE